MARLYSVRFWPVVAVAASGVAVGTVVVYWNKFCRPENHEAPDLESKKQVVEQNVSTPTPPDRHKVYVLPCLLSLIEALQDHVERLQLEMIEEDWDDWVKVLLRKLDGILSSLDGAQSKARGPDTSGFNNGLERVATVLDDELVPFLRSDPAVSSILDNHLPRRGQTWDAFLEESKTEDERLFYDACSFQESIELQVKLIEALVDSVHELERSLEESLGTDATRGDGEDTETLTPQFEVVKVFYATDRAITADAEYLGRISVREMSELQCGIPLQYGWVEVAIPVGVREVPSMETFEEGDPSKQIVVLSVNTNLRGDLGRFLQHVNHDLENEREKFPLENIEVLVYIHGYKSSHLKAVRNAAQLKHDLGFKGVLILYSWSSKGTWAGYGSDAKNIQTTTSAFGKFLKRIMAEVKAPRARCNIIAHSMGNRALIEALKDPELIQPSSPTCPLSQIICVAADEERGRFEALVRKWNAIYKASPQPGGSASTSRTASSDGSTSSQSRPQLTVYCSTEDWPLFYSRMVNSFGRRRLGDTTSLFESKEAINLDGHDVIDVTGTSQSRRHSYHLHSPAVMADIKVLLTEKKDASRRTPTVTLANFKGRKFYAFDAERWTRERSVCMP